MLPRITSQPYDLWLSKCTLQVMQRIAHALELKSELMIDFVETSQVLGMAKIAFKSFFTSRMPSESLIIVHENAPTKLWWWPGTRLISRIEKLFGGNDHHF